MTTEPTQAQIEAARLSEENLHSIGHARYLVERATPDNPDVCFDYELVADLLSIIDRLTAAAEVGEPSDSKIAAVAKAIKEAHEWYGNKYTKMACAAIEAAEVGERDYYHKTITGGFDKPAAAEVGEKDAKRAAIEVGRVVRAETIERCARVADNAALRAKLQHESGYDDCYLWCHDEARGIAAAIRALKERP